MQSTLVYTTKSGNPRHVDAVARMAAALTNVRQSRRARTCPDRSVEVHELGEFSMTCYRCHMYADS